MSSVCDVRHNSEGYGYEILTEVCVSEAHRSPTTLGSEYTSQQTGLQKLL